MSATRRRMEHDACPSGRSIPVSRPFFAGEVSGVDITRPLSAATRPPRSRRAWTTTPCWCSTTRHSPTSSRSRSPATSASSRTGDGGNITKPEEPAWPRHAVTTSPISTRTTTVAGARRPPPAVQPRQPAVALRQFVPRGPGEVFAAVGARSSRRGRQHRFADMRAAYDALDDETKAEVRGPGLRALADLLARHPGLHRFDRRGARRCSRRCASAWCARIR